jgi:hypothetical protein
MALEASTVLMFLVFRFFTMYFGKQFVNQKINLLKIIMGIGAATFFGTIV